MAGTPQCQILHHIYYSVPTKLLDCRDVPTRLLYGRDVPTKLLYGRNVLIRLLYGRDRTYQATIGWYQATG